MDISLLNNILNIDIAMKSVLVEANVSMDKLVDYTMRYKLILSVVPEVPGITVGGAFVNLGGQSSFFRHDSLDRNVRGSARSWLSAGKYDRCHLNQNRILLISWPSRMAHWVSTSLELILMDAKDFVELSFEPVEGIDDILAQVWKVQNGQDVHYVEAILCSAAHENIISGRLKDSCDGELQNFPRAKDPYFYMYARHLVLFDKPQTILQHTLLGDYISRHDHGVFWVGKEAFE